MALTDPKVKTAKAKDKPYKLTDEKGLYLLVKPNGSKYWQYRFRLNGKQGTYQIGVYPDITLKEARDEHALARTYIKKGTNPKVIKQKRTASKDRIDNNFSYYLEQWIANQNMAES